MSEPMGTLPGVMEHMSVDDKVVFLTHTVESLCVKVDVLTEALRVVGEQQQYTVNMAHEIGQQFSKVMSGGGPMGMLAKMMGVKNNG